MEFFILKDFEIFMGNKSVKFYRHSSTGCYFYIIGLIGNYCHRYEYVIYTSMLVFFFLKLGSTLFWCIFFPSLTRGMLNNDFAVPSKNE